MNPIYAEKVQQHHVYYRLALPLQIQTAVVKSSTCLSTVKVGYHFDVLRNESASTDKSSEHMAPGQGLT